jgi:hypothetical protein
MARFGKKLKVEWSNSQLIPTLLLSIYSGRWAAWRDGKENPHRHGAHRYKPMGVPSGRMVLGEHHTHHIGSQMQTGCQKNTPINPMPMGA